MAACSECRIRICQVEVDEDGEPRILTADQDLIVEKDPITSLCLSRDSRCLLVTVNVEEIHAWDLVEKQLIHSYAGQKQGRFIIRSSFGGTNEAFVASGSEDSQVAGSR